MAKKGKGGKKAKIETTKLSITQQAVYDVSVPEELYERAKREIKGESLITPFSLSQKLGVSISTAKKILRRMHSEGIVTLYSPGKRCPVYVPRS